MPGMGSAHRIWPGLGLLLWVAAGGLLVGCSFHPGGAAGSSEGDAGGTTGDDDGGGPPPPDAGPCPEAIHTVLSVNGQMAASSDQPMFTVLLGDTVSLSAAGSCTQSGTPVYTWTITDQNGDNAIETTALPDLTQGQLTVFPEVPGDYTITLTVGDGTRTGDPVSALGIRAIGWTPVSDGLNVRDLALSGTTLWIAADADAYFNDLRALGLAPLKVNDFRTTDDTIPNDLSSVWFDGSRDVWFGHKASDSQVWKVDLGSFPPRVIAVPFGAALPDTPVRDIGAGPSGVEVATQNGVADAPNNSTFQSPIVATDSFALARGDVGGFAGGAALTRLSDGATFDVFSGGDDKIRTLLSVGSDIWAGSDGSGVVRFDTTTGQVSATWTSSDGLGSNKIRSLAVDGDGDLWAVTDKGVARFKQDRQAWFSMGAPSGLSSITDLSALLAVGQGDQRFLVVGGNGAIAYLTLTNN